MKLHYMGKFNLDPDSLPQAEHKPGAAAFFRIVPVAEPKSATITWFAALLGSIVIIFPHELPHALCFKKTCIFTQISSRACCLL